MRLRVRLAVLLPFLCPGSFSQGGGGYFELILPELNQVIGSGNVVADVPARPLSRIRIQVLGSADKNLGYGDLHVRINGKSVSNIFNTLSNDRGKLLAMDESTIKMRTDRAQIFDPRENTIEAYGKDRRGRTYYQNWILRSGTENVNAYFTYVSEISPSDETGLPPDINLDEPKGPVIVSSSNHTLTVRVKGLASSASSLASLSINGKPVRDPARGLSLPFDEAVGVTSAQDALTVEATDQKGNRRRISVPVIRPGVRSQRVRVSGDRFAVIIGISKFTAGSNGPPPLPAAAADARELATALRTRGFKGENVRLLLDEEATVEQIRTALGDFTGRAKREDFLVVFLTTQGMHDPSAPDKVYLAASDTQRRSLSDTAIEISELQMLLNRAVRCRHTLLFFDAEHPLGQEWAFQGKPIVNSYLLNLFDGPLGRSVLVSGAPGQEAQERKNGEIPRGLFASVLDEGLSGAADIDHDGVITARELCSYVSETVRRSSGGVQYPQFHLAESESEAAVLMLGH